jgi:LysR family transcriptional regulator, transcriptional activator of the cysJI operon
MTDFRLHTFLEVFRQKGFTRAADALHITQPAVTQHIKYLEEELGHALFTIQGRSITLTPSGEILLRYAQSVEADAKRMRERIDTVAARKNLRFGATRTIGEFVMPPCIARWMREYPETDISMVVDNSETLFRMLESGELDFLFVEGLFNRDTYSSDILVSDSIILAASPEHPLAGGLAPFNDLLGETLIIREKGSGGRDILEQTLALNNRSIRSFRAVLEIGNIGAIKALVEEGVGIAFLYERSVQKELSSGALARISVDTLQIRHDYSFVCLKSSLYESEYRKFLEFASSSLTSD